MARIFSITFRHNGETYNTLVSVRTMPLYVEYTLNNLDAELLLLLPGNKIISTAPKHFHFPNATPYASTTLMNSVIKAVCVRLQAMASANPSGRGELL